MTAQRGISVVICCYNSANRLPETLRCIFSQVDVDSLAWELLLVDNASTDATQDVARSVARNHNAERFLRITVEPQPGQMYARFRGIVESLYDLILFCDDDNHLDLHYLSQVRNIMDARPAVGIAGGWNKPKLPFYPGGWVEDNYTALGIGKQSDTDKLTTWVFGAGMTVRRKVFDALTERGIVPMLSGRDGSNSQAAGDDAEICAFARFVGFEILYTNQLVLEHAISPHRLTKKFFIKSNYRAIHPVIYLQVLEHLIDRPQDNAAGIYRIHLLKALRLIASSLPRCVVGRHRFFNFLLLYQNTQILPWLLTKRRKFFRLVEQVKGNLRGVGPGVSKVHQDPRP